MISEKKKPNDGSMATQSYIGACILSYTLKMLKYVIFFWGQNFKIFFKKFNKEMVPNLQTVKRV